MIQIATNNEIILDGQPTGYGMFQEDNATRVNELIGPPSLNYSLGMPRSCYSVVHADPAMGIAGPAEFERDFRAVTGL